MDNLRTLVGEFIRIIIDKQSVSMPIRKQSIKDGLGITQKEMHMLIRQADTHLQKLGLELVGINKGRLVGIEHAEKFFIRRLKPSRMPPRIPIEDFKGIVVIFAFVILEHSCIEEKRLCNLLHNAGVMRSEEEFFQIISWAKKQGYLCTSKDNEQSIVELGWKYHCEFPGFDPRACLKAFASDTKEQS
ncbi:hypothetical protein CWI42_012200 [Ordospora colligata]|uniref:MAGE domain-containing protein n=1 Tax=Ordospora colligata OC4 TaxID=1354746 RepID=A0A0B2UMN5_9MICR|nr:uncharacterized protein M896_012200 [Ordospora colligata OC4]KHN70564.1 hypothetical protein M896_012200 [Ordospora colligata OC4]TBU17314.1 hypothetical protein CWI41_012200 [Ordospora colligata]TBU17564.1 hypothetical protein CWI40_012200 [Ordospora colligata]TBU19744.1 hypothetical protein CWI42_012200 [Ordospora colligata]